MVCLRGLFVSHLVTLTRPVSQPEVIPHHQTNRSQGDAHHQKPASALLFATLLRFFRGAFRTLGCGLW